jgi:hypothetical protein
LGPRVYLLDSAAFVTDTISLADSTFAYVAKPGVGVRRTVPVGGNNLVVLNAELRIRDPFFPGLVEYVPFIDAGQVWTTEVGSPRFTFRQIQVTPGLGFRYFSPVGPIQANVGYNRYANPLGPAYFAVPITATNARSPLICVTAPGVTPVPFVRRGGEYTQPNIAKCPNSFAPPTSTNFFSRLRLTLSIGTDF